MTSTIFILLILSQIQAVDIFPQKNPGIRTTYERLFEYPEMLYFKPFLNSCFCTFDSNITVSTCLVLGNISTASARRA